MLCGFSDLAEEMARRQGGSAESWDARERASRGMADTDRSVTSAMLAPVQWLERSFGLDG